MLLRSKLFGDREGGKETEKLMISVADYANRPSRAACWVGLDGFIHLMPKVEVNPELN